MPTLLETSRWPFGAIAIPRAPWRCILSGLEVIWNERNAVWVYISVRRHRRDNSYRARQKRFIAIMVFGKAELHCSCQQSNRSNGRVDSHIAALPGIESCVGTGYGGIHAAAADALNCHSAAFVRRVLYRKTLS
jgi:hypothetical protein